MRGPISMTLNGSSRSFLFYHGGILDTKNCKPDLNHAVVGVGYGTDKKSGKDYIIIKNSWGKWWGNGGYAKIAADSDYYTGGACGILKQNHIALVKIEDAKAKVDQAKKQFLETPK